VDQHDLARGRQGFQSGGDRSASLGTALVRERESRR
jgi:hypothetical protein